MTTESQGQSIGWMRFIYESLLQRSMATVTPERNVQISVHRKVHIAPYVSKQCLSTIGPMAEDIQVGLKYKTYTYISAKGNESKPGCGD